MNIYLMKNINLTLNSYNNVVGLLKYWIYQYFYLVNEIIYYFMVKHTYTQIKLL